MVYRAEFGCFAVGQTVQADALDRPSNWSLGPTVY